METKIWYAFSLTKLTIEQMRFVRDNIPNADLIVPGDGITYYIDINNNFPSLLIRKFIDKFNIPRSNYNIEISIKTSNSTEDQTIPENVLQIWKEFDCGMRFFIRFFSESIDK